MPLQNGINSIIHSASTADLTAYTYTKVYAGVTASPTINGTLITMQAGSIIPILVRSISATANVFVIGDKINTTDPGGTTGIIL
jgi:hypothetical protein